MQSCSWFFRRGKEGGGRERGWGRWEEIKRKFPLGSGSFRRKFEASEESAHVSEESSKNPPLRFIVYAHPHQKKKKKKKKKKKMNKKKRKKEENSSTTK